MNHCEQMRLGNNNKRPGCVCACVCVVVVQQCRHCDNLQPADFSLQTTCLVQCVNVKWNTQLCPNTAMDRVGSLCCRRCHHLHCRMENLEHDTGIYIYIYIYICVCVCCSGTQRCCMKAEMDMRHLEKETHCWQNAA